MNNQFEHNFVEHTVAKKELLMALLYLGMSPLCFKTHLQKGSMTAFDFLKLKLLLNCQHK